ncbi:MAG: polysaccharide biosynthesis C-terminal domain-containing protein [Bacteroidota bacterium]
MQKNKLIKNSLSAIIQVIIVGLVYLLLYRYLLDAIGIELLGVWSLIIATTSLALIANFGISTSIIKFVSTYYTRGDFESLKKLIFTSCVFILVTYLLISGLILLLGNIILPYFIEKTYISIALEVLPYSLVSLIINAVSGVISSCLDGIQKNYVKSYILSFSSIFLFGLSLLLTPDYGLKGLVFAQIFQGILVLLLSFYFISKYLKGVISFRWNWSKPLFSEIINYGLKMQALSFMQMSFEPVTKAFLSKFGGLAMVGYYEMASRLVSQIRGIIVSANQVIIPVVAEAKERNDNSVKTIYVKTFSIILFLNILITSAILVFTPLISQIWIGKIVPFFLFGVVINSIVVFINISSNPGYFSYLGEGKLNWLIISYAAILITNTILGYVLGLNFNGYGVILAWNLAFMIGSLIIVFSFQHLNGIKWKEVMTKNDIYLIFGAALFSYFGFQTVLNYIANKSNLLFICAFIAAGCFYLFIILKNKNFLFMKNEIQKFLKRNG